MKTKSSNVVSATYAAKNFGALVDRVREEHAVYEIESHGKVVARVTPVEQRAPTLAEFVRWLRSRPPLPAEVLDEIERASAEMRALPARISDVEGEPRPRRSRPRLATETTRAAKRR